MVLAKQNKGASGVGLPVLWSEHIGKEGWTQDVSIGINEGHATFTIDVYWSNLDRAIGSILGYSFKSSTGTLSRITPMRHPIFYWMRAKKISKIQGVQWLGKDVKDSGTISRYQYARITIFFETPQCRIEPDGFANEWDRYVIKTFEPTFKNITLERGSFKWAAGTPAADTSIDVSEGLLLTKTRLKWKWLQVPEIGLMDTNGVPQNILNGVGKVNDAQFAGYPAGTLLCETPKFEPVMMPVSPTTLGNNPFKWNSLPRAWNVEFSFLYFNPDPGGALRGHNLAPYKVDRKWYEIVSNDGNKNLYDAYDFTKFFTLI